MSAFTTHAARLATRAVRRHLVGDGQEWVFAKPGPAWTPGPLARTSLYLHVPFCNHRCPYCPYTTVRYRSDLVPQFVEAARAELDEWAEAIGAAELTSVYIGGGTPTLAMDGVARVLDHMRDRFKLTGPVAIETHPDDVTPGLVTALHDAGVRLVSLGVQSFDARALATIGRGYGPASAERALGLLAGGSFDSVNADLMFALPGQTVGDVLRDLEHAVALGADQLTAYPLFTFPFAAVGRYRGRHAMGMPPLHARRTHYRAITGWCESHGLERVSVWGFRRGGSPRYSSVTRDGYIGVGPGAGSQLPDGFVLNTFDFDAWLERVRSGRLPVALRLPFTPSLAAWWWLYWRLYETRVALADVDSICAAQAPRVRRWLGRLERARLARRTDGRVELTERGAFWVHLAQNYFALDYVDTLWTESRRDPWPPTVPI